MHLNRSRGLLLGAFLVVAMPAAAQAVDPWPMAGRDAAHRATADGPEPPYRVAWEATVGDGEDTPIAAPVVGEDLVVVVTRDRAVALDPASGDDLWEAARDRGAAGPAGVASDMVLFASGRGEEAELVAVSREDGEETWRAGIGGASPGGVTVTDDLSIVGTRSGEVVAVALESGDEAWRFESDGSVEGPPAVLGGLVLATAQHLDERRSARLHAIDPDDGSEEWSVGVADVVGASSAPSAAEGLVVFGGGDLGIRGLDPERGSIRWEATSRSPFPARTAAALPQDVVTADLLGNVYLLDAGTGEERWLYRVPGLVVTGGPAVAGSAVLLADQSGQLSAIDLDRGVLVWRDQLGDRPLRGAAATGDLVVVASEGGTVTAFEHDPDGELLEEASPTTLFVDRALLNYAAAFVLTVVVLWGLFGLIRRWRG